MCLPFCFCSFFFSFYNLEQSKRDRKKDVLMAIDMGHLLTCTWRLKWSRILLFIRYKFVEKKRKRVSFFVKIKTPTIMKWLFLFILTYEHDTDIKHIHYIVHVYVATREKTTTARNVQHINCLLVSCSLAFLTRPSLSLSSLPHPVCARARHYSHNYSLLSIL